MIKSNFCIPVLMYHHVNPEGDFINVKPQIFESHIRYLKEHGYIALNTGEFLSIIRRQQQPPKKPIMITFDDGWLDNWVFAYPILKKYATKAVIFVITSMIVEKGRRQRSDKGAKKGFPSHVMCQELVDKNQKSEIVMSWDELREMESSGLIDIQSHSHTHQRWDKLYSNIKERHDVLSGELKESKRIIEDRLKKSCNALCWPWGIYNNSYINIAKSLGYEMLFTTEKGTNTPQTDPYVIKRIVIGNIGLFSFQKKLFIHSRYLMSRAYLRYFKT